MTLRLAITSVLVLIFFPSPSSQLKSEGIWASPTEAIYLASRCGLDPYVFGVRYGDISIAREGWIRIMECPDARVFGKMLEDYRSSTRNLKSENENGISPYPIVAIEAATATLRWCDEFVAKLGLCPWAKQSLSQPGAVRVKIVQHNSDSSLQEFEHSVREAASEFLYVTDRISGAEDTGHLSPVLLQPEIPVPKIEGPPAINPTLAITFVVLAPSERTKDDRLATPTDKASPALSTEFSFYEFYEFVDELESALFDEADDDINPIGDLVTLAGFHPNWEFSGSNSAPINFEKRTPYPTISLVLTESIDAAGEEATERIGRYNEDVLNSIGTTLLAKMFQEKVLLSPNSPSDESDSNVDIV